MQKKVDDLVMKAAVNLSRRSFFKKLGGLGLGAGLGLAGMKQALACDPCFNANCSPCNCYASGPCGNPQTKTLYICENGCGLRCRNSYCQ